MLETSVRGSSHDRRDSSEAAGLKGNDDDDDDGNAIITTGIHNNQPHEGT